MKWLFLLLLAINVAIFIWGVQRSDVNSGDKLPLVDSDVETIELLDASQLAALKKDKPARMTPQAQIEINREVESEAPQPLSSESRAGRSDLTVPVENPLEFVPPTLDAANISDGQDFEDSESAPFSLTQRDRVPDRQGESGANGEAAPDYIGGKIDESEVSAVTGGETPTQELSCWTVGPVEEKKFAETLVRSLGQHGVDAGLREVPRRKITGYWVLLPPYDRVQSAIAAVAKLKAQGVDDVQRFYKGEFERGVSLGVYNRRFNAEKRRAQIEAEGFSPQVLPRYKEIPSYLVDYKIADDSGATDEIADVLSSYTPERSACENLPANSTN